MVSKQEPLPRVCEKRPYRHHKRRIKVISLRRDHRRRACKGVAKTPSSHSTYLRSDEVKSHVLICSLQDHQRLVSPMAANQRKKAS